MDPLFDLAIIGAGPAGLAAAVEARRGKLENIIVFEKGPSHSQMIRTFYKEGKRLDASYAGLEALCMGVMCLRDGSRESYLSMMDHVVTQEKIPIEYLTEVRSLQKLDSGVFEIHTTLGNPLLAKTIVVAIGRMNKPTQPDYWRAIPSALKSNKTLLFDINTRVIEKERVLVIGGGDSAAEYAQMLCSKNSVTISYRRQEFSRMNPLNLRMTEELVKTKKIRALMNTTIASVEDREGKPLVVFSEGNHKPETFDCLIYALGGMTPIDFLRTAKIQYDQKGEPIVSENFECSVSGIYAIGDLLGKGKGGGSIIAGFNSASIAVNHLLVKYFNKEPLPAIVGLEHLKF